MIDRRAVIAGIAAGLTIPAPARAATADLAAALDLAAASAPATGLAALARFDAPALPLGARLDLVTARAGLGVDAAIARRFGAAVSGRTIYRVTPRAGAWRATVPDAAAIDRDTDRLASDHAAGIVLPRAALERTIAAIEGATTGASPPVTAALSRQRATLIAQRDVAPLAPGIGRLRDGAALYELLLKRAGGPATDPAGALRRLEAERDRLLARAARRFGSIGMTAGSVGARYALLWRDPRWLYTDDAAGRALALADMNRMTADARARIPAAFGDVPAFCLDASARAPSPAEIAADKPGYRILPAPGRDGAYVVDLRDIRRRPSWTLPSVVAHELLPGHMLQLGIEGLDPPHQLRLDYAAAFVEGWGIYAETLADRQGAYATAHAQLGHLHWLLFRVGRAIVDLRLHLHGWSLTQARAALVEWQGEPAYFAPFDRELDRIALEPASRVAEALAWCAIRDAVGSREGTPRIDRHRAVLAGGRKIVDMI